MSRRLGFLGFRGLGFRVQGVEGSIIGRFLGGFASEGKSARLRLVGPVSKPPQSRT